MSYGRGYFHLGQLTRLTSSPVHFPRPLGGNSGPNTPLPPGERGDERESESSPACPRTNPTFVCTWTKHRVYFKT
eukprot:scaffold2094_cov192-Skeletonema_marinoi.AAC.7